ncbi:MAG: biotin--[acetyl-CoA-carboxylase] ligase [Xanthomonadaceae bacterium]|nr:biotin--[acetyl-CoA-carboxylase] ligase [Xanthomonadaceae bacterium]
MVACCDAADSDRAIRQTLPMHDRELLERLMLSPARGEDLAHASGQTRAAVWKRISALRTAGLEIGARRGLGYVLDQPLELLSGNRILGQLAPELLARVASLDVIWSLDSTNSELLRRATPPKGVAIALAERQTGGRGRRGRTWTSPLAANIYLSLARLFSGGLARLPGLSLVAGIATAEALQAGGFADVRLKWPNDLVVVDAGGWRKLGGLLVEGGGEHAGPARAVIGLGLNVRMPRSSVEAISQPWTDLATLAGAPPSRNALVAGLLEHWLPALDQFDREGLSPFLQRYARLDVLAGREVSVHAGDAIQHALAVGLAEDGSLRVRVDGREQRIHSGDVSVRNA